MKVLLFTAILVAFIVFVNCDSSDSDSSDGWDTKVDDTQLEYAKGSVCGYCRYCQFCTYCSKDCPCEQSKSKPNCHMCKYCKFCYLCQSICDTICTPGGVLDSISSAIVNALPTHDAGEVASDIDSVQEWISEAENAKKKDTSKTAKEGKSKAKEGKSKAKEDETKDGKTPKDEL